MDRKTVLFVEDDAQQRRALRRSLSQHGCDVTILEASDFALALRLLRNPPVPIDVVLLDVLLPGGNGLDLIPVINEMHPPARVVVQTVMLESDVALRAQQSGALFLPKPVDGMVLVAAISSCRPGLAAASHETLAERFARSHGLSSRQQEVVEGWMCGLNQKDIATRMGVTVDTVSSHSARVFDKTGCRGKTNVVKAVLEQRVTKT